MQKSQLSDSNIGGEKRHRLDVPAVYLSLAKTGSMSFSFHFFSLFVLVVPRVRAGKQVALAISTSGTAGLHAAIDAGGNTNGESS